MPDRPISTASNTAAAMANTPGSPPETTATWRPAAASDSAMTRAIELDAIVGRVAALGRPGRPACGRDRDRSRRGRWRAPSAACVAGVINSALPGPVPTIASGAAHSRLPWPGISTIAK